MTLNRKSLAIISSAALLLYFICLILISHFEINYTIIGVFQEMLTLPLMLIVIGLLVFNIVNWRIENFRATSAYFYAIILLSICVAIIVLATVFEI